MLKRVCDECGAEMDINGDDFVLDTERKDKRLQQVKLTFLKTQGQGSPGIDFCVDCIHKMLGKVVDSNKKGVAEEVG